MISITLPQNGTACNGAPAESPAELPEFTFEDAYQLGFDHNLASLLQALRGYLDDLRAHIGDDVRAGLNSPQYHRAHVRQVALRTAEEAVAGIAALVNVATSAARQAAAADRFVKHLEAEYAADKELAAARRKRRRISRPAIK